MTETVPWVRERDFVIQVNGTSAPTPLATSWLRFIRLEQGLSNAENPKVPYATSDDYKEKLVSERGELSAQLPGADKSEVRGRVRRMLKRHGLFEPWRIDRFPPSGDIFPPK